MIFIDEIDSLCSIRNEDEDNKKILLKKQFKIQMTNVGKSDSKFVLIGSTKVPWELDPTILKRFEKVLYIPWPDKKSRLELLKIHLGKAPNSLTDSYFSVLSDITPGYSGFDMFSVVKEALMGPIKKCQSATWFKQVQGFFIPSLPGDGFKSSLLEIPDPSKVKPPLVCMEDFKIAIAKIKPTVTQNELEMNMKFTKEFGVK